MGLRAVLAVVWLAVVHGVAAGAVLAFVFCHGGC